MPNPNFDKLNQKIRAAGADWVAGETPLSKYYGTKSASKSLGLALTPEIAFGTLQSARSEDQISFAAAAPPPPEVDWRKQNNKNWVTPVRDQKSCGSCVAFATLASLESRLLIAHNKPGANFDLSEANLFHCGAPNSCDTGWQPELAFQHLRSNGVGLESNWPYIPRDEPCKAIPVAARIDGHNVAGTSTARKVAVGKGPVVAAMAVFGDFTAYTSGIYRHIEGGLVGYHAVCIIGYSDTQGCWIAKNSWNPRWGESGFFRIRYGECGIDTQFPFTYPTSVSLQNGVTIN
ncbi:MAG: C1 family peptidase [Candidatus Devosia phytovorans]|uniref:C1 family peptidase n=1 Tax=Candidatus Devosia phytovorans TaxID=3121372 RepID=A0AAJ5VW30_9HYPH|nr:C1 family peptidase [Devosia sp.]WEK04965.1 MAG: C1 family peptidase [Devosia sp.]